MNTRMTWTDRGYMKDTTLRRLRKILNLDEHITLPREVGDAVYETLFPDRELEELLKRCDISQYIYSKTNELIRLRESSFSKYLTIKKSPLASYVSRFTSTHLNLRVSDGRPIPKDATSYNYVLDMDDSNFFTRKQVVEVYEMIIDALMPSLPNAEIYMRIYKPIEEFLIHLRTIHQINHFWPQAIQYAGNDVREKLRKVPKPKKLSAASLAQVEPYFNQDAVNEFNRLDTIAKLKGI